MATQLCKYTKTTSIHFKRMNFMAYEVHFNTYLSTSQLRNGTFKLLFFSHIAAWLTLSLCSHVGPPQRDLPCVPHLKQHLSPVVLYPSLSSLLKIFFKKGNLFTTYLLPSIHSFVYYQSLRPPNPCVGLVWAETLPVFYTAVYTVSRVVAVIKLVLI